MRSSLLILCSAVALGGARLGAQAPTQPVTQPPATSTPGASTTGTSTVPATASGTAPAQPTARGRHGHGGMQRGLLRGITLSTAQRAQLQTIRTRYRDERRAARSAGAGAVAGDTAAHGRGRAMRQRQLTEIRGVLTPDQQATFDRNVTAVRAQHRQQRANATGTTR